MRWIIYQASDAGKKLSRYQTVISQIYVKIFHQCTKTEIPVIKAWHIWKTNKRIYIYIYASPPFIILKKITHAIKNIHAKKKKKNKNMLFKEKD